VCALIYRGLEFEIEELRNSMKRIKVKDEGNATHLQFSLLSNSTVNLKITLKRVQHDYEIIFDSASIALVEVSMAITGKK
jgi:hypothetical protein